MNGTGLPASGPGLRLVGSTLFRVWNVASNTHWYSQTWEVTAGRNRMSLLSRIIGYVPREERGGIRLEDKEPWRVSSTRDVTRFLRALNLLVPDGSVAYFESTGERHVAEHLRKAAVTPAVRVALGTIWPRPDCYHFVLTAGAAEELADFLDHNPCGFFCAHLHVYRGHSVLLQWYDAFDDPIYVSRSIDERAVSRFACALGVTYGIGW